MTFNETKRFIVDAAKSQAAMNAHNTVFDANRLIGRNFSDPGVQSDKHTPIPNKATPPPPPPHCPTGPIFNRGGPIGINLFRIRKVPSITSVRGDESHES